MNVGCGGAVVGYVSVIDLRPNDSCINSDKGCSV
jgi:hypothetical protein